MIKHIGLTLYTGTIPQKKKSQVKAKLCTHGHNKRNIVMSKSDKKKRGTPINLWDLLTIQPAWSKPAERACSHPLDKRVGRKHPATPGMPAFLH